MDRPFDKDIAARHSAKVSPALAKARPKDQPAEDPAAPADASAATLGVSDLAATREVRADLADRLPDVERVADTEGAAGNDEPGGFGDLASLVGTEPSGADAAIADAEAGLAGRFEAPSLTDGPERVDAETAIADAKAGLPGSELRESANSMLFEEASNDTTPAGIADQGTDAVSDAGSSAPKVEPTAWEVFTSVASRSTTAEGRASIMKELSDGTLGKDTSIGKVAGLYQDNLHTGEVMSGEGPKAEVKGEVKDGFVKVTPEQTVITVEGGVRVARMLDGKVVRTDPDGTKTVTEPDGSTTKVLPNGDVEETPPPPSKPDAGIPDPEGGDDRFRFISEGLKGRLGPQGVEGGGDIDFGDDIPFGVGSGAQIVDQQGVLLGDAGRGGAVAEGPATSGFQGFDLVRNSGAVDFEDESPLGGGLEDDPFDETAPSQNLDGGLAVTDDETTDETDETEATETSDSTDDTP